MSNISHHPHDKLVGRLLKDRKLAIEFLSKNLPSKSLEKLDLSTLEHSSETGVTEGWKKLHNDLVFRCKTKDKQDAYVYLLVEHQSTPDPLMPVRLLRYKLNVLGKYLDAKNKPKKLPNIVSVVLYHGEKRYPYHKDAISCFEDEELAEKDIAEPMHLVDLADISEDVLLAHGGADALLKLLLKYSRKKDFVRKIQYFMERNPRLFVSLSTQQASFVFEYVLHVGEGTPDNAKSMKTAINEIYGESKAQKVYSLMDYFRDEARREGEIKSKREIATQMVSKGIDYKLILEVTGLSLEEIEKLKN